MRGAGWVLGCLAVVILAVLALLLVLLSLIHRLLGATY